MAGLHHDRTGHAHGRVQGLPAQGDVIAGKYAIVRVLGEGGMGIVFEATHLRLRQRVAVKMLLPTMLEHPVIVTRFEREARAAGQLRSRHVARVMDVDVTPEGLPYMVMEFLEGHDLQVELERRGRLTYEEVVDYVLQTCAAMIEAHQLGIVHRDLKPSNLYLAVDGESRIVKVLDFGISKVQSEGDAKLTEAETVMGTAMYMSPEQVRSSGGVDGRSDIWALGVILFELLTGRPPWIGTPTQVAAAIVTEDPPDLRGLCDAPLELGHVIRRALQRNRDARFATVKELAVALALFAPQGGAGRVLADGLAFGSSGSHARVSIGPVGGRVEDGRTLVQAAAVSESRMGPSRDGGTAPGWSQHNAPSKRGRALVIGFSVAFVVALLVLGGGAAFAIRARNASHTAATAATATASESASSAASVVTPSAPPDVPPPTVDPGPGPAGPASATEVASGSAPKPRVTPGTKGPGATGAPKLVPPPPGAGTPTTKPPAPKPAPSPTNPLTL